MPGDVEQTVPVRRLASMLGLTERRVQQLADEGILPKSGRGRYPLDAAVLAYVRYVQAASDGELDAVEDFNTARARKMSADADIAEINAAARRGELVERRQVEREAQSVMLQIRTRLEMVSYRVAPRIVGETNERRIRDAIDDEVASALTTLAEQADVDDDEELLEEAPT